MSGAEISTLISESINSLSWSEKQNYKPADDIVQSAITMTVGLIEFYLKAGLGLGPPEVTTIFFHEKGWVRHRRYTWQPSTGWQIAWRSSSWWVPVGWKLILATSPGDQFSSCAVEWNFNSSSKKLVIVNYSRAHRIQLSTKLHLSTKSSLIIQHETWQPHIHPDF